MATEILKPTSHTVDLEWVSPELAYDGSEANDNGTYAYSNGTADNTAIWSGFPDHNQLVLISFKFYITSEFLGSTSDDIRNVQYSADGGSSWTVLYDCSAQTAKNTQSWDLNFEGDLSLFQVGVKYDRVKGADSGLESRIWDIYVEAIGEDIPNVVLDTIRSRSAFLTTELLPNTSLDTLRSRETSLVAEVISNTIFDSSRQRSALLLTESLPNVILDSSRYRTSNVIMAEAFVVSYNCLAPMVCLDKYPCLASEIPEPTTFNFIPLYMSAF